MAVKPDQKRSDNRLLEVPAAPVYNLQNRDRLAQQGSERSPAGYGAHLPKCQVLASQNGLLDRRASQDLATEKSGFDQGRI